MMVPVFEPAALRALVTTVRLAQHLQETLLLPSL
jgi:hypothetical protein